MPGRPTSLYSQEMMDLRTSKGPEDGAGTGRDKPAIFLALGTPGGVEHLYREVGVPAAERSLPAAPTEADFAPWPKAAPKYGLELLGPPLPEQRY